MTIRVLIVDDQPVVRTGFETILGCESDIEVVGTAADGVQAVAETGRLHPDVVLMDVRMPKMDGIEATSQLVSESVRVLILTTFDLDEYVYGALRAGASGFLLKDVPRDDLVRAVRTVAAGDALLAPSVTRRLIAEFAQRPPRAEPPTLDALTPREREVLELVAKGMSNTEIGAHLYIGEATVKTHVGNILMKLGLRDRIQAVILGYEAGLVGSGN